MNHDLRAASRQEIAAGTGLSFAGPYTHTPWRQYSRALKRCLLVSEVGPGIRTIAVPTPVAELLSRPGSITCDEYFHFLARTFTEPSPAMESWDPNAQFRYPLLFALKYLLAKRAISPIPVSTLAEIIGAYRQTGFTGDEDDASFIGVVGTDEIYGEMCRSLPKDSRRQARESLQVICQISYLHLESSNVIVSLDPEDAQAVFADLAPVGGPRAADRESEIRRLADLFRDGATEDFFDYPNTVINDAVLSGFLEGSKVKRTHITIERNQGLRAAFFAVRPTALCDVCALDTAATYPWAVRVLDLHHLLPLSSGTRVVSLGTSGRLARTTFDDLVPVCPSCHRAIHWFYDSWLSNSGLSDFPNEICARDAYRDLKAEFHGAIHA